MSDIEPQAVEDLLDTAFGSDRFGRTAYRIRQGMDAVPALSFAAVERGALIGTIVFMTAHHFLSDLNPQYWQFWLGAVLVLIVLFARDGIMGLAQRLRERLTRRATP